MPEKAPQMQFPLLDSIHTSVMRYGRLAKDAKKEVISEGLRCQYTGQAGWRRTKPFPNSPIE